MEDPGGRDALVARLRAAGCVFAEDEARLLVEAADDPAALEALVGRRIAGEPLEHLVGWVEFGGLRLRVGPGVFVPRQRTRALASLASALVTLPVDAVPGQAVRMLELCSGAAPVASRVLRDHPACEVLAVDIDPVATACAALNVGEGRALTGDLFSAVPAHWRGTVVVCAANAPYVPTAEVALMPTEARDHEPLHTLDGGGDGLGVHRRIAVEVTRWLAPGGSLLVEVSRGQSSTAAEVYAAVGMTVRIERDDDLAATVVVATWPGAGAPPRLEP